MIRHAKASSVGSVEAAGSRRRAPLVFLGALILAVMACLGAASAIADTPPTVTIGTPTDVSYTSVHVSGTVNPEGGPSSTTWFFETTTDPTDPSLWEVQYETYGEISGTEAEESNPITVGGTIPLRSGVKYYVRLVAENGEFTNRTETPSPYPSFTTLVTPPPTITIDTPTGVTAESAHFSGSINPGGTDESAFSVGWHFQCTPVCPGVVDDQHLPAGTSPEPVSANTKGLQPNTTYQVKLIASNAGGPQESAPKSFTTDAVVPTAATLAPTVGAAGTSAVLGGNVNPENSPTTYWVEYGSSESYGQSAPVTEDAAAGSGGVPVNVGQEITGLTPDATYHFRLVAKNAVGTVAGQDFTFTANAADNPPPAESCPNAALRVGFSAALPECRAYEQVSAQDKNESNASGDAKFTGDGKHVLYGGETAYAGSMRGGPNFYLATPSADGWQTKSLSPALPASIPQSPVGVSVNLNDDGSRAFLLTKDPLLSEDTNHEYDWYLRASDGTLDRISKPAAGLPPVTGNVFDFEAGNTADLSHLLFQSTEKHTISAVGLEEEYYGLYEWTAGSGLRLVNVDSQGDPVSPYGGGFGAGVGYLHEHAISSNGERIFFTTPSSVWPAPAPYNIKRIYLREAGQTTTEISATQCTEPSCQGPDQDAEYQGATSDGSAAFFISTAQLTNTATPGGGLYRYDVGSGELTLLTPDATDPGGARVEGEVMNSDDGSLVYFVAKGKLAAGATLGSDNLYVYDAATVATRFIATVSPSDFYLWNGTPQYKPASLTPSGEDLVFKTATPLATGYDTAGHTEIYRYDASDNDLTCIACRPAGGVAQTDVYFGFVPPAFPASHVISDDGSRVFFQTAEPLVASDTNGQVDVYEWHEGRILLISSGTSSAGSILNGSTASGNDVLFFTWQSLTASDKDEHIDVYDARVDGGFQEASVPPAASCSGAGCRDSATSAGSSPSPGSATFTAAGDIAPGKGSGTFRVSAISASQAKKWASTGLLSLRVKVSAAGRVRAAASGRLGGRSTTVARASAVARRAGMVSLALRLSKPARSYLKQHGRLPLKVTITYSKARGTKRAQLTLRDAGRSSRGQR